MYGGSVNYVYSVGFFVVVFLSPVLYLVGCLLGYVCGGWILWRGVGGGDM